MIWLTGTVESCSTHILVLNGFHKHSRFICLVMNLVLNDGFYEAGFQFQLFPLISYVALKQIPSLPQAHSFNTKINVLSQMNTTVPSQSQHFKILSCKVHPLFPPGSFFAETGQLIWKHERTRIAKIILKQNKIRGLILADFKT